MPSMLLFSLGELLHIPSSNLNIVQYAIQSTFINFEDA
jgi:hypothetical protein